jgi:hypothetical protein
MKKITIASLLLLAISYCALAQKGNTSLLINAGTAIPLLEAKNYSPGLHLGAIFAYGISNEKNDALTVGIGYHTIKFKLAGSGSLNMADVKIGYRFFPSAKAAVYFHPNAGVGFFTGNNGGKQANINFGMALGYLPKVGKGNLNIFAAYNKFSFSPALSLLHLGMGYQLNFKGK